MLRTLLVVLVAVAPVTAAATEPGGSAGAAPLDPALAGRQHYESFCSNCHGDGGRGNGPLADLLRIVTPDLTRLAERNGGEFPADFLRSRIDGTEEVRAHGKRMMPVWGRALDPQAGRVARPGDDSASRLIDEMVAYLETIQADD